jgi:hypothetical protein
VILYRVPILVKTFFVALQGESSDAANKRRYAAAWRVATLIHGSTDSAPSHRACNEFMEAQRLAGFFDFDTGARD